MRFCSWICAHGRKIPSKVRTKKIRLITEQIEREADIYHTWQNEGTDGTHYEVPELYRSVGKAEIEAHGWSLIPSKYIEFIEQTQNALFRNILCCF